MKTKLAVALSVAALAPLSLAACGDDDEEPTAGGETTTEDTSGGSASGGSGGSGGSVAITAAADGSFAYEEESVSAEAGDVTIDFDNPAALGHDVRVEGPDGDDLGGTEIIAEDTATATVPLDAGDYTFYCSVAGHRAGGMEGSLTVE